MSAESSEILRRFPSKKNKVYLCRRAGELVVFKRYATPRSAAHERALLQKAADAGLAVPRVLDDGCLEYIEAPLLLDLLEGAEERIGRGQSTVKDELPALASAWRALLAWLVDFQRATGLIAGDVNARNYLFDGAVLTGFDLEDARPGVPEEDIGRALAFLLNYDPPDSPLKRKLAARLRAELRAQGDLDLARVEAYRADEQEAIVRRRGAATQSADRQT